MCAAAESHLSIRHARQSDISLLHVLMTRAIEQLLKPYLSSEQIAASHEIMGIDTQLIEDGTYFVAEFGRTVAGCGGWSRRATHFGGDHSRGRDSRLLDSLKDAARVRAMYTHPDFARRGVGRAILARCEQVAATEGFRSATLVATLSGVPLYRACGYSDVESFDEITPSGVAVPLIRMRKNL